MTRRNRPRKKKTTVRKGHGMLWDEDPIMVTRPAMSRQGPITLLQDELERLDGLIESEKRYVDGIDDIDPAHGGFCEGKIAAWSDARNQIKNVLKKLRNK